MRARVEIAKADGRTAYSEGSYDRRYSIDPFIQLQYAKGYEEAKRKQDLLNEHRRYHFEQLRLIEESMGIFS